MERTALLVCSQYIFLLLLMRAATLLERVGGDPRAQTILIMCGHQKEHNTIDYSRNFCVTVEKISEQMRTTGFGQAVSGSGPGTNYGLAQCYGDLSLLDCMVCYVEAQTVLPQCYPSNGGRIFCDGCFMRTETYNFFQEYTGPQDRALCGNTTRKSSAFEKSATDAVNNAVTAAPGNAGYAHAHVAAAGTNESAYVLAKCWRSLRENSCRLCLENASATILECLPWSEGRALNTGCFMRYSEKDFLNKVPANGSSRGSNDAEQLMKTLIDSSLNFKCSTLDKATNSFAEANNIGQGGFGTVYKGVLPDGREIAVKRLFFNKRHRLPEFYNEVNIISSVQHKNLVRLLGCSFSGPESLLVYEFLPNKSLDHFIFDSNRRKVLNWDKRYDIITGTAEGLVYLHENCRTKIIQRDVKASNILLDSKLRAKIADFGLARSFQQDQTHISTGIAGTLGSMAPEYLAHGQLTEKADVYSFGVVLQEIVTGKQNNRSTAMEYSDSLVTITWKHFQSGMVEELYDPNPMLHSCRNSDVKNKVMRVVHIGLLCTQEIPNLRPSTSKVLKMLRRKEEHLPALTKPPFMDEKTMELNNTCKDPGYPLNAADSASIATMEYSTFYAG